MKRTGNARRRLRTAFHLTVLLRFEAKRGLSLCCWDYVDCTVAVLLQAGLHDERIGCVFWEDRTVAHDGVVQ